MMLPAILRHPHARLTAAADADAGAAAAFARDFQAETYSSVEALCGSPSVDAIYIATPTQYHTEHVLLALEHGKHVVIEKPMALSLDDADRMIRAAEAHGDSSWWATRTASSRRSARSGRSLRAVLSAGSACCTTGASRIGSTALATPRSSTPAWAAA